jgi:hypothetical protein
VGRGEILVNLLVNSKIKCEKILTKKASGSAERYEDTLRLIHHDELQHHMIIGSLNTI